MSKDKYDRQTRLWGEGQILICASKLLCLNSDSLSSEILKNLILSGVGEVTLIDKAKITQDDTKTNFFVDLDDIGKCRGEIVLKNLLELNPDVKGNFIEKTAQEFLDDANNNINKYDIIIAANLKKEEDNKVYEIAKKNGIRIVIVKNNGLFGYLRIFENYHGNMCLRLMDNPVSDFRLSCPWKELIDFADSFDLEKMDLIDHKNVPYFIILLKALIQYRKNKNDPKANPKTKDEKSEFKKIVESYKLNIKEEDDKGENENIEEALGKLYYCNASYNNLTTYKLQYIFDIIEKTPQKELLDKCNIYMKLFFLYFYALKKFYAKYESYPLCGSIPDMISSTTNFINLKKLYNSKAEKEHKEMRELITSEIKENQYLTEEEKKCLDGLVNNLSLDKIDIVDILNKNWPQTSLFVYPDNTLEKEGKNLDVDQFEEDFQKLNFVWYLLFRASDEFEKKNGRYPGDKVDDFKKDVPELFNLAKSEYEGLSIKPDLGNELNENNAFEFCRMGRGDIPPIISVLGSMTGQEIIKLITYEFETVNNTVIYDGINVTLSNIKI